MTSNPFINTTSGLGVNAGVVGTPGAITATSSTNQAVTTGSVQFQVPPQAAWAPGMFVSAVSQGAPANYMTGTVVSYSGTALTVDVLSTGGAGSYNDWLINLAGSVGPMGATGPQGSAGANGTSAGPVNGSAYGLKIKNNASTPSTQIDISAIAATMINSSGVSVRKTPVSLTIDLTTGTSTSAANGMDGEARGTSQWIYLYLINNGTTTAGLGTLNSPLANPPTLPSGYTSALYVGAMYVDSSGNLLRTLQLGRNGHYTTVASTNTATLPVMSTGATGSISTPTWTAITLLGFVPATASKISLVAAQTNASIMVAPNNAYGALSSTTNAPPIVASGNISQADLGEISIESASVYLAASGGQLYCDGWTDYCVAA